MKYYYFTNSADTLCHKILPNGNYNVNEPYSYRFLKNFIKSVDKFRLPTYILEHKRKWTDLISVINLGYSNLVISEKFATILQDFNTPKFEQHPVKIVKRKKENIYHLFHFLEAQDELIDFSKSIFNKRQKYEVIDTGVQFQNIDDYLTKTDILKKEYGRSSKYKAQKIYFKSLENYDLLFFQSLYFVTIISKRLKDAVEAAGITGVDITPLEDYKKIEFLFSEPR